MLATRTFLFSDLRDYTRFVETHGDEAARTLIADYRRIVRAEIAKHEGGEVKTEGDSFYVVFTTTGSAVSCAAAILREADRYSRERPDRPMRIGAGIHAGEPVPHEGQFVGSAVIVAARLAQNASAGELLITDVVRALLPRSLTLPMSERIGLVLKGIQEQPKVYAVDWRTAIPVRAEQRAATVDTSIPAAAPGSQQVICPVVIGRDREAAALDLLLGEAIGGRGRTVLVAGEAGLGKSALVRRFVDRVRERGARLLIGECTEIEARRPFGPIIDAFVSGDLALPPELAQGGPGALPVVEVERYRVHVAFADRLAEAAKERPAVVVIEDLHWADEATYELLPYLARKLRDDPVLLLATYRSDELHRLHPLNHVLAELGRGRLFEEVRLKKLTLEETGDVIRASLALTQAPSAEFRQALFDRTEGNPFFVEEILRALVEKGELEYRDGSWHRTKAVAALTIPASVRDAVQQRLLTLEPRARTAMNIAAVIGLRFDFELLQAVSGLDEGALFEIIKGAIDAQLVREETGADGLETYTFRHALSREAVLAELLQRERRILHRTVGEAIERLVGAHAERRAEELAYHFDEARDSAKAQRYHRLAAERSLRMAAPKPALQHLERAIELAPDDDQELVTLLLRLADVATSISDSARARRAAEQALAIAKQRGDLIAMGDAAHRLSLFTWALGDAPAAGRIVDEAVALLEPLGPSAALAACYTERARLAMLDDRSADAIRWGETALAMARETGAVETEVLALNFLGVAETQTGDQPEQGVAHLERSLELAEERGLPYHAQRALNNLIAGLTRAGAPHARTKELHERSVRHAKQHGLRIDPLIWREVFFGFAEGRWDEALRIAEDARNETLWTATRDLFVAQMRLAREGPEGGAIQLVDDAWRRCEAGDSQSRVGASAAGVTYFLAGRYAETLDRSAIQLRDVQRNPTQFMPAAVPALRSAWILGDAAAAKPWIDALTVAAGTAGVAQRAYGAALAHRFGGRPADAERELRVAIRALVEQEFPVHSTIARQDLIEVLLESGRRDEAQQVAAELLPFWRAVRATWYVGRLEAWLRERGLAVPA
ncbi:MAG TPA: AAA family ATPase [Candidatus Limnocylindria bacterium]